MAVHVPNKFEMFVYRLNEFPFIRIALFDAIVYMVFSFLWGLDNCIASCIIFIIPMAIVAKIFSSLLNFVEHSLTILWIMSLFIGIEIKILSMALQALFEIEKIENIIRTISLVFSGIANLALFLAAIAFLIRVFVALFLRS